MKNDNTFAGLPKILNEISLKEIKRIDAGLEGDWSPTVLTIWSVTDGLNEFDDSQLRHEIYKPCLELYFEDTWVGIHCYKKENNQNIFDRNFASKVIKYVEMKLGFKAIT